MASSYPGGLDAFTNPTASDPLNSATVPHATQHANANDAIEAIQAELGTDPAGASATVKARFEAIEATGWVTSTRIADGTIVDGDINAAAAIAQSKIADLTTDLAAKAPLASPTFTGTVTTPLTTAGYVKTSAGGVLSSSAAIAQADVTNLTTDLAAKEPQALTYALTADRALSNVNTAQSLFGVGVTLAANTTYLLEMAFAVGTTGTTSNSLGLRFASSSGLTWTSIGYHASTSQSATGYAGLANDQSVWSTVETNTTITAAVATATYRRCRVRGLLRTNASGVCTPQITYSAAPGVAPTVLKDSWIRLTPIGTDTLQSIGTWA